MKIQYLTKSIILIWRIMMSNFDTSEKDLARKIKSFDENNKPKKKKSLLETIKEKIIKK
jgi:hypothetical protein